MACQSCLDQTTLSLRPGPAVSTPGGAAMGGRPWLTRVPRPAQAPVEGSLWSKTCPALAFSTHHWHPWPFPSLFFIVGPTALSVPICTLYLRFAICSAQIVRPHTHTHTHTHTSQPSWTPSAPSLVPTAFFMSVARVIQSGSVTSWAKTLATPVMPHRLPTILATPVTPHCVD